MAYLLILDATNVTVKESGVMIFKVHLHVSLINYMEIFVSKEISDVKNLNCYFTVLQEHNLESNNLSILVVVVNQRNKNMLIKVEKRGRKGD